MAAIVVTLLLIVVVDVVTCSNFDSHISQELSLEMRIFIFLSKSGLTAIPPPRPIRSEHLPSL